MEFNAILKLAMKDYEIAIMYIREAINIAPTPVNYIHEIKILNRMGNSAEASIKIEKPKELILTNQRYHLVYNKVVKALDKN